VQFAEHDRYTATIADAPLSTRAWFCLTPERLLLRAPRRRSNVTLYGVAGQLGRPTVADSRTVDLLFEMVGHVDEDGVTHTDPEAGLAINKRTFESLFLDATVDAFGCVAAEVEDRDGTVYGGSVQLDPPIWGDGLTDCSFTMTVVLVDGELAPVGS
jgi:hypothetical protein